MCRSKLHKRRIAGYHALHIAPTALRQGKAVLKIVARSLITKFCPVKMQADRHLFSRRNQKFLHRLPAPARF